MIKTRSSIISNLNHLVESNLDREKGYKTAADAVDDERLKTAFINYARDSERYVKELHEIIKTLNGDADESGSISGTLFRGWMNIQSIVTGKEAKPILDECERGEDSAVLSYREALRSDLSDKIRDVIQRQYSSIKAAHDNIRNFRDNWKESS
ncbi:MAG: PA2169 family four-helix-bundle protein [Ignavibacteriae bacterium]|nr:MAG: PA2169 family four-helix-bundle protein [Ignavibacteriota bacterium]